MQWYPVEKEQTEQMLEKIFSNNMPSFFSPKSSEAKCAKLPFYTNFLIYRLTNNACLPAFSIDFLSDGIQYLYLDGSAQPIYRANASGDLLLNENTILDYMAFFVHYVPGPDGEILLIDSDHKIYPKGLLDIDRHRELLYTHKNVDIEFDSEIKVHTIKMPMYYGGALVNATITLNEHGYLAVSDYSLLIKDSGNKV